MSSIFPIILNSANAVPGDTSKYVYKFPRGSINLKNASVAVGQINMFYSWGNINKALYNNADFQIIYPDGSPLSFTEYNVTIPDGNYTIEDINKYLQSVFITNKKYLVNNTTGSYKYFMELLANPQTYSIQLIAYEIPTSLPTGYSTPPGGFSFPAQPNQKPALVIASNNNFGTLLGFSAGAFFDHISDITPQMSPVSSVLVTCSLINNKFTNPNNIIFSFVSGSAEYGRMLSIQNQNLVFSNIDDGVYTEVTINFIDNNFKRLIIKDTNLVIYLIVKIDA
jgi:hypothetical protein